MINVIGKQCKIVTLAAAIGLALGSQAAFAGHYVNDAGTKSVVTNSYGECWEAKGGKSESIAKCGDKVAKKEKKKVVKDSDGDGVADNRDECPNTPKGVRVTSFGCPKDSDGDGVADYLDQCPGTPAGARIDANGCELAAAETITINLVEDEFDFDSARLKPDMTNVLTGMAAKLNGTAGVESLDIVGHTDSVGPKAYNQKLSERRAKAVADYLVGEGVPASSMTVSGEGENNPIADNSSKAGRAKNRRVEITVK